MDTFRIKPLPGREYKINHGGKVVITVASSKQGNTRYNQCGWYGCRVLHLFSFKTPIIDAKK